jgi:hypothetical protein
LCGLCVTTNLMYEYCTPWNVRKPDPARWHNLFRRYILTQIDITTMMVPEFLRSCGLHPNEVGLYKLNPVDP